MQKIIHELFINFVKIIHELFINFVKTIHELFVKFVKIIHKLFINFVKYISAQIMFFFFSFYAFLCTMHKIICINYTKIMHILIFMLKQVTYS